MSMMMPESRGDMKAQVQSLRDSIYQMKKAFEYNLGQIEMRLEALERDNTAQEALETAKKALSIAGGNEE